MRVTKLRMTAFGPFPRTQEIDFTRLGSHPLFLINGPTGSGKTTILDAICFALYGETTGTEREGREMRCDHADTAHETAVELEFELGMQCYRILRTPEQERPKQRGEGTTKRAAEAQLFQVDVEGEETVLVPRKTGDANRKIVELTGLSGEQFRQIMVLPQGKFRNFLLASSEERQKIFVTLFGTEIYSRLEVKLKENANRLTREVKSLNDQQAGMLKTVGLQTTEELRIAIADKDSAVKVANTAMARAAEELATAQSHFVEAQKTHKLFVELEAAHKRLEALSEQEGFYKDLSEMLDLARLARDIRPDLERREERETLHREALKLKSDSESALDSAGLALRDAKTAWKAAEQDKSRLEKFREEKTSLEKHRARVSKLTGAQAALDRVTKQQAAASNEVKAASQKRDLAADELENLRKARGKLEKNVIERPVVQSQMEKLKRLNKDLAALGVCRTRVETLDQRMPGEESSLHRAGITFDDAVAKRASLEKQWNDGQAAILAQRLAAGEPCPVCGSTDHPSPAHSDVVLPTGQDIDNAKSSEARARAERDKTSAHLDGLKVKREESSKQLADMIAQLGEDAETPAATAKAQLETAGERLAALADAAKQLKSHDLRLGHAESALKQCDDELARARKDLDEARTSGAAAQQKVSGIEEELPEQFRVPGALEEEILNLTDSISGLDHEIENARERLEKAKLGQAEAKANLDNAQIQVEKAGKQLELARVGWAKALLVSKFEDEVHVRASFMSPDEVTDKESRLKEHYEKNLLAGGEVKRLTGETEGKARPAIDTIRSAEADARVKHKAITEHCAQCKAQLSQFEKVDLDLRDLRTKQQKLEAEYKVVGTISNVASGQNEYRTSLQRFVLGVLLDDVLVEAGQKLQKMSRGRYQLRRSDELVDRRSASGLDLVVDDAYTGKHRGVATLSGGESFLAALSLALGLSSVVQAYAGGIRLDTLFIDEGFGSLDSEALDLAINTLLDLQSSGITVGVISHVGELKDRMDTRVDLYTDQQGSRVEIVTP